MTSFPRVHKFIVFGDAWISQINVTSVLRGELSSCSLGFAVGATVDIKVKVNKLKIAYLKLKSVKAFGFFEILKFLKLFSKRCNLSKYRIIELTFKFKFYEYLDFSLQ